MSRNKGSIKAKRKRIDSEKLELFVSKASELRNTRLAKEGFNIQHKMHGQKGQTVEYELKQPDEADLKDYLLTFRHFISEKEDVFLNHILNICHHRLTSNEIKQNLTQAYQAFKQIKLGILVSLHVDGRKFTPLQITDMYLNGKYFHNDLEYQQQLDDMLPFS